METILCFRTELIIVLLLLIRRSHGMQMEAIQMQLCN